MGLPGRSSPSFASRLVVSRGPPLKTAARCRHGSIARAPGSSVAGFAQAGQFDRSPRVGQRRRPTRDFENKDFDMNDGE